MLYVSLRLCLTLPFMKRRLMLTSHGRCLDITLCRHTRDRSADDCLEPHLTAGTTV